MKIAVNPYHSHINTGKRNFYFLRLLTDMHVESGEE